MSKRNYTQYSKQPAVVEETPVTIEEEVKAVEVKMEQVEVPVTESPVVETPAVEAPVVEAPKPQPTTVTGVVANCTKLNVRAKAAADAAVVCVINAGAEVTINIKKSKEEWFKVKTAAGVEGYCMRKFVNANL